MRYRGPQYSMVCSINNLLGLYHRTICSKSETFCTKKLEYQVHWKGTKFYTQILKNKISVFLWNGSEERECANYITLFDAKLEHFIIHTEHKYTNVNSSERDRFTVGPWHGLVPWRTSRTAQHLPKYCILQEDSFYQCVHSLSQHPWQKSCILG